MDKARDEERPIRGDDPADAAASPPVTGGASPAPAGQAAHGPADAASGGEPAFGFLAPAQAPGEIGRLGPYRVLRVLGQGGMGVVFQAEDVRLKRLVALKAMLPAMARRPEARERFLREARAAAAVEHDHIVPVHQVDEDRGVPYIAMPLLKGLSLEDFLKKKAAKGALLSPAEVCKIGREIAKGLAAAHERGLVHRDVKPANIWLDRGAGGRVKILDFGLALLTEQAGDRNITQSGVILGTPGYLAPEQAQGGKVDARADLFSLGVVLYRLCTGEVPFRGPDAISILLAVAMNEPPSPKSLRARLPQELSDLVMRLLAKDPAKRPASAGDVVRAIGAIEKASRGDGAASVAPAEQDQTAALSPTSRPDREPRRPPPRHRSTRRRLLEVVVAATAVVGAAVVLIILFRPPEKASDPPNAPTTITEGGREHPPTIIPDPKTPRLKGHTAEIRGIRFLPDGKRAVSTSMDGHAILWDIVNEKLIRDFPPPSARWREGNTLKVRALDRGLAISPDGKLLATGSEEDRAGIISVYDLENETLLWSKVGPPRPKDGREPGIISLAFQEGGTRLYVAARGGMKEGGKYGTGYFNSLNSANGDVMDTFNVGSWVAVVSDLTWVPHKEQQILCSVRNMYAGAKKNKSETSVVLYSIGRKMAVRRIPQPERDISGLALFPDGERVAIAQRGDDAEIQIWPLAGKEPIRQWKASVASIRLLRGGRWLLTTGTDKRTMTIWDAETGKPLHTMQTDNAVAEVADVSPDGKWLLTGGGTKDDGDFDLHLWRPE